MECLVFMDLFIEKTRVPVLMTALSVGSVQISPQEFHLFWVVFSFSFVHTLKRLSILAALFALPAALQE